MFDVLYLYKIQIGGALIIFDLFWGFADHHTAFNRQRFRYMKPPRAKLLRLAREIAIENGLFWVRETLTAAGEERLSDLSTSALAALVRAHR